MSGTRFAMVSGWMHNGNISQFVSANRDVNRFELVSLQLGFILSYLLLTRAYPKLAGAAEGLVHMHEQGMIHGDLKGVRTLALGQQSASNGNFVGQYSHRRSSPCPPGGLRITHDHIGDHEARRTLKLVHSRWHVQVDEP